MYRYVVQTWEPVPALDGEGWVAILCPPNSDPEMIGPDICRFRLGEVIVSVRYLGNRFRHWIGPAFEVAASDDLPVEVASELASGVWDRFSHAVRREIALPGGRTTTVVSAHLITIEAPGWAELTGSTDPAR